MITYTGMSGIAENNTYGDYIETHTLQVSITILTTIQCFLLKTFNYEEIIQQFYFYVTNLRDHEIQGQTNSTIVSYCLHLSDKRTQHITHV